MNNKIVFGHFVREYYVVIVRKNYEIEIPQRDLLNEGLFGRILRKSCCLV